jgi:hypothetical protein
VLTDLSFENIGASSTAVSADLTNTGVLLDQNQTGLLKSCTHDTRGTDRQPGLFRILTTCFTVSAITFGGVISI